ncbi:nucleotidyltransferase domain-containing protein [Devosia sp. ZW T5_3]|uniref:nucleotidyltransferase domain-containing protein n=1 Tax=Devosia sp. ZW T5_3 TaxID=3378085 RepID=UPI0038525977
MDQHELIAAVKQAMTGKEAIRGLFLAGSYGRGTADAWSDVDLVALVEPEHHAAIAADWRQTLDAITPIVFWQELPRGGLLLNAVSEEWLRCDLSIVAPDNFGRRAKNTVKPLVDRDGRYDSLPDMLPPKQPDVGTVKYLIHEFIRMLGLMPVGAGRGEYVTMVLGVGMMRDHLAALLMQDVSNPDPGGILHQSTLLSAGDMALLKSLPYPGPERDAVISANFAIAREFMPRARAMAKRLDIVWPEAFEAATRRRLAITLGEEAERGW